MCVPSVCVCVSQVCVCVWPKCVQGSSGWAVKWVGVKWICGPSLCVWSKCMAKVLVCVCGLSVCRGQVGGESSGWVIKWVCGQSGSGSKCMCHPSVSVWPVCVYVWAVCICVWPVCMCVMPKCAGVKWVGSQVGGWSKWVRGQSVRPKCMYVCGLSVSRGQVDGWSSG